MTDEKFEEARRLKLEIEHLTKSINTLDDLYDESGEWTLLKDDGYVLYADMYGECNTKYHALFTREELGEIIAGLVNMKTRLEREFNEL